MECLLSCLRWSACSHACSSGVSQLRELDVVTDDGGDAARTRHHLLPPRPAATDIAWARLDGVRLLSSAGGSCDVFAASLDGEHVAVKKARSDTHATDLLSEAALLRELQELPEPQHPESRVGNSVGRKTIKKY